MSPLSSPSGWSFAIWGILGLACLWLSLYWIDAAKPGRWFGWALVWFPVFASISIGQNSLLSLGILSLTYFLWCRDRRRLAGLACSPVLYKPQLALGIGYLWMLEWRRDWQALLDLAFGGALLAGAICLTLWITPHAMIYDRTIFLIPAILFWEKSPDCRGLWKVLFR